jgi:hypothetical protein
MLEFDASVCGCEVPIGFCVIGIAFVLPGGDFLDEGLFIGNAAVEALSRRLDRLRRATHCCGCWRTNATHSPWIVLDQNDHLAAEKWTSAKSFKT